MLLCLLANGSFCSDGNRRVGPLHIGLQGAGKIALDEHIPAIRQSGLFVLVGCTHCLAPITDVPNYPDLAAMLEARPDIDAVAICSQPQAHYDAARLALQRYKHVLLEKPPCPTVAQLDHLAKLATRMERTLFQTWHLCESGAVAATRRWLATRRIRKGRITWKEEVRRYHPGQTWLWQADGFGVFDAGINALAVLTKIFPGPIFVKAAELLVPSNCETPVAATTTLEVDGCEFTAEFDFRHVGETKWEIAFDTDAGAACLAVQNNTLTVDGRTVFAASHNDEYASLYGRFDRLIREHRSEVDKRPLKLVADIFLIGRHIPVGALVIT